jgi:hypothetical protein
VVGWDPVGIVGRGGGNSGTLNRDFNLLGRTGGLLRRLDTLGSLALLGKVRCDPDGVEEVSNTTEASQKEEVKEDTKGMMLA